MKFPPKPAAAARINSPLALALAVGVCIPFLISGIAKALDYSAAMGEMAHFSLPLPALTAAMVILIQIGGSAVLIFARGVPAAAASVVLAIFTIAATYLAHGFWRFGGQEQVQQMNIFFEHVSIAAALLYVGYSKLGFNVISRS